MITKTYCPLPTAEDAPCFDRLLQASRRVDWRFLLPTPQLGHVACEIGFDSEMIESLRLFSASLTILDWSVGTESRAAEYDVVVASAASKTSLNSAGSRVRPGGHLYVEAHGRLSSGRCGRPWTPTSLVRHVKRRGLCDVTTHWHWPDFLSCTDMIPLGDTAVVEHVLQQRRSGRGGAAGRCQLLLVRMLLRTGLLLPLVPCFSVLARRPSP